ncbi:hypothetical protein L207DRAFT_594137 [Hyaloscypha variabilis F]|uniref:2EXR domain-containing protein n=1 Tax=Hyaloscypha variabilis (strain UAMH 11265 / GT02V1 / F) TaxID=1149755 RepID=A0A2J6QR43_HYAVF|nr:hypothetical protein L207DRAFT_594137 [Hyaloscypha variabilis F]
MASAESIASSTMKTEKKTPSPPNDEEADGAFKLFPKLPKELRLKIWGFTLPGSRLIDTSIPSRFYSKHTMRGKYNRNPIATMVCSESREVASKRFRLLKGMNYNRWVDYEEDFFVATKVFWNKRERLMRGRDWAEVRNVVFDFNDFEESLRCVKKRLHLSGFCGGFFPVNLKKVMMIDDKLIEREDDEMTMMNGDHVLWLQWMKTEFEDLDRTPCARSRHSGPSHDTSQQTTAPVFSVGVVHRRKTSGNTTEPFRYIRIVELPKFKN